MHRTHLIAGAALAVAATLGLGTAIPAYADDCFNASRSTTGNAAAAQAGTWWDVPEILAILGGLTPDQIAEVLPVIVADPRVPTGFTVFYNPAHPGELAHAANPKTVVDGRGIDHSDDYATPVFAAIFEDVAIALG